MTEFRLKRRGFDLGVIASEKFKSKQSDPLDNWASGKPVLLSGICRDYLAAHANDISRSDELYASVLEEHELDLLLDEEPYASNLLEKFESLGCSVNEGDDQEIETILFDAIDGEEILAEDLWMKASWLSFYEDDASLRFRFSFGVDHVEDVAADKNRQHYAALLTDAIFPESRIITQNQQLNEKLDLTLANQASHFVERIVYFNAPQGGAYMHHDRERGHAGVVYAQLSGSTFWLALSKQALIGEIQHFIDECKNSGWPASISETQQEDLLSLNTDELDLAKQLETFSNSNLIQLVNETNEFVQQLIAKGHGRIVGAGDAMLLPQKDELSCCWHSVFCIGDESGQALSFAIRTS